MMAGSYAKTLNNEVYLAVCCCPKQKRTLTGKRMPVLSKIVPATLNLFCALTDSVLCASSAERLSASSAATSKIPEALIPSPSLQLPRPG